MNRGRTYEPKITWCQSLTSIESKSKSVWPNKNHLIPTCDHIAVYDADISSFLVPVEITQEQVCYQLQKLCIILPEEGSAGANRPTQHERPSGPPTLLNRPNLSGNTHLTLVKVFNLGSHIFLQAIVQPMKSKTVVRHLKHTHFLPLNMENHLHHQSLHEGQADRACGSSSQRQTDLVFFLCNICTFMDLHI